MSKDEGLATRVQMAIDIGVMERDLERIRKIAHRRAEALAEALSVIERYASCRHGSPDCFCTREAERFMRIANIRDDYDVQDQLRKLT